MICYKWSINFGATTLSMNSMQHNDTQHKGFISYIQHNDTQRNELFFVMLNVIMLSVIILSVMAP